MKLQLLFLVTIFWLAFVASHAAISPEVYWKVKLSNTQIPKVIKDFLPQTVDEVRDLKRGDSTDTKERVDYGLRENAIIYWHQPATEDEVRDLKRGDSPDTKEKVDYRLRENAIRYWHRPATEDEVRDLIRGDSPDTKEKVDYGLRENAIIYWHRPATEDEVRDLKQQSLSTDHAATNNYLRHVTEGSNAKNDLKDEFVYRPFFLEKDLEKGKAINFPPLKSKNNEEPFLPRQLAESIPFSSGKIPQILNQFSIESSSKDAQDIKETIKICEVPEKKGEKKMCATSLESMVDFSISVLGTNNIKAVTTVVEGEIQMIQKYTMEEVRLVADGDIMACHKLNYAYAVHYCHAGGSTKTYMVSMVGADGTKVEAVAVCHKDTSFWNPKSLPFVILKVKPGTTPICHFLIDDQVAFIPSKEAIDRIPPF